jgi:hypothetical protein
MCPLRFCFAVLVLVGVSPSIMSQKDAPLKFDPVSWERTERWLFAELKEAETSASNALALERIHQRMRTATRGQKVQWQCKVKAIYRVPSTGLVAQLEPSVEKEMVTRKVGLKSVTGELIRRRIDLRAVDASGTLLTGFPVPEEKWVEELRAGDSFRLTGIVKNLSFVRPSPPPITIQVEIRLTEASPALKK